MLKNKRVFISGGNGVIGNCLVMKLHEMGAVIFVGDLKPRPAHWPKEIRYRQGDLNFITQEELNEFSPSYFFHLAATFERSDESYSFWRENFQHNVHLSNHLMTCMKDCSTLEKVIFASSYLIYDPALYQFEKPADIPYSLKEADPIYPRNLTGMAKLAHEIELRFINHFKNHQYKSVSARIYRGHGCNSRDIISRWVRDLIHKKELTVYRKEGIFDYIYSEDSAEGLIRLALCKEAEGVINLGTGKSRKVADIIDILKKHFPDLKYKENEFDINIPYEASQADITILKQLTGWSPEYSLEKSIGEIVDFESKRAGVYSYQALPELNVLVTSISKKVPLLQSVKKALNKLNADNKLYGGDISKEVIGRYFVDQFWVMPKLEPAAVDMIIEYCLKNGIKLIIPTRDGELMFWAENREAFAKHDIHIMVSDKECIENTLDKLKFFARLNSLGISAIDTAIDINELSADTFVVKERFGAGSVNTGLNLIREKALAYALELNHSIYQPYISGKEYSADLYVTMNGIVKGVVVRSRDIVVNGESQITTVVENPGLEKLCKEIALALSLRGHAVLQVIEDRQGKFHVIECNARFGGASTLSIAAGLDSFYWCMLEVLGVSLSDYPFNKIKAAVKQVRYATDALIYEQDR